MTLLPKWGINFTRPAANAGGLPLVDAPLPAEVVVPVNQNIGFPAIPVVAPGDRVLTGQPIAAPSATGPSAPVHAPLSGTVRTIETREVPGRSAATCIIIDSDGLDTVWNGYPAKRDPLTMPVAELRNAVREAGLVGLGGAMFPTDIKLNPGLGVTTLILNGAECEPRISCDDALMRSEPDMLLHGARIMLRVLEADECRIAVKENSPALAPLQAALAELADDRFSIVPVPAVYPIGGENQLIEYLTDREVPANGLPWDAGVICQNVATAAATEKFFRTGQPLISRIVTVSGGGVDKPANVRARIGMPVSMLIECAGGYTATADRLVMGGPMTGVALDNDSLPVTKGCNSIYVPASSEVAGREAELPCIRCGECATACPVRLTPQLLLQHFRTNQYERLQELALPDCIECGVCDYVCPSRIPLTAEFRRAKQALWEQGIAHRQAERAERRYTARTERLSLNETRRERELDTQIETLEEPQEAEEALRDILRRAGLDDEQDERK